MSKPSGFVPIDFYKAGQILLIIGIFGFALVVISTSTGWFTLPSAVLISSLASILVSLYLIFIIPKEKSENT